MSRSIGVASPDWIRCSILWSSWSSPRGRGRTCHGTRARRTWASLSAVASTLRDSSADDDRAGPEHRAGLGEAVEVVANVEIVLGQHRGARASGEPELDLPAAGGATGQS